MRELILPISLGQSSCYYSCVYVGCSSVCNALDQTLQTIRRKLQETVCGIPEFDAREYGKFKLPSCQACFKIILSALTSLARGSWRWWFLVVFMRFCKIFISRCRSSISKTLCATSGISLLKMWIWGCGLVTVDFVSAGAQRWHGRKDWHKYGS